MPRIPALLAGLCVAALATATQAADLALVGARVYPAPDAAPIDNAVVLIHDGRIAGVGSRGAIPIPPGAAIDDVTGAVITAGFWNSHVHLIAPVLLKARDLPDPVLGGILTDMFNRWGFTTVFDLASTMASANEIRGRITAGKVPGPHVLTVGEPFFPKDGTPIYVAELYRSTGLPKPEIQSIPEAVARVDRQVEQGADGVKLFTGAIVGGAIRVLPMPLDQARAVTAEAHRLGRPVFAHPTTQQGLDVAIEGGVDILAHTAPDAGPWTPAFVARLKAHHMALIPTMTLFDVEMKKEGAPADAIQRELATVVQQVRAQSEAGGEVLFGTDVGYIDTVDTTEEYQLMGRAMDWRAILAALTTTPARRFHQAERTGRVQAGLAADLVVLNADPATDVTAFAKVRETLRDGVVTWRRKD